MTTIIEPSTRIRVNTTTTVNTESPSIALLSGGRYVITWQSLNLDGSSNGVYFQIYDAGGSPIGVETRANTTTAGSQSVPTVVSDGQDGFFIVWEGNGPGDTSGIFFQHFDATGNLLGSEILANTTTASNVTFSDISVNSAGVFNIVWNDNTLDGSINAIVMQRFTSASAKFGVETTVNTTTNGSQTLPSTIALSNGNFLVTWFGNGTQAGQVDTSGVYFKIFNQGGGVVVNETRANADDSSAPTFQSQIEATQLANGNIVFTWDDSSKDGNSFGTFASIYTSSGTLLTPEFRVNTTTFLNQEFPEIVALSDGGFMIVYVSTSSTLFGQRYSESGQPIGPETALITISGGTISAPFKVIATEEGGFIIAYTTIEAGRTNIFQRRFSAPDTLSGSQYLYGTDNEDELNGGSGKDFMYGGDGNDTYYVTSTDVIEERLDQGFDTVHTSSSFSLPNNFEALILDGFANIFGNGNSVNNVIVGNISSNSIFGFEGNDILSGEDGNDTIAGGTGNDTIYGGRGNDTLSGDQDNDTIFGDDGDDQINGNDGIDELHGGAGNDQINGDLGLDTIYGDDGNDNLNAGSDASGTGGTLYGGAGNDTLFGSAATDYLYGGDGDDFIQSNGGFDAIFGEAGNDNILLTTSQGSTVDGGDGTDLINLFSLPSAAVIDLNLGTLLFPGGSTSVLNFENVFGTAFGDTIIGNVGANTIIGGSGADKMYGRGGDDIYYVDDAGDKVFETYLGLDTGGIDTVYTEVSFILPNNVENLIITGPSGTNGTGNSAANLIKGNNGSNTLNGGSGADELYGYGGDDVYVVDNAGDVVSEFDDFGVDAGGDDRVNSSISYTLGSFIERLSMTGTANIDGVGNSLANTIIGNSGNNKITGGAGNDSLRGEAGDDTYIFGPSFGRDTITEVSGNDTIQFASGITSGMIIFEDVGADRYYAIADGVHVASACAHRIRIVGGAGGAVIENIVYSTDPAPASSATLIQAMVAQLQSTGAVESLKMAPNLRREAVTLTANLY